MNTLPRSAYRLLAALVSTVMVATAADPKEARLADAFRYIEESEYDIRWQDAAGTIQAPNRAQNLRVSFYHDGFGAIPRQLVEGQSEWSLSILLDQVGRVGRTTRPVEGEAQWAITRGQARQRLSDVVVEYQNTKEGLRQNFHLDSAPRGSGPVRITLSVETSGLTTAVNETGDGLRFTDATTGDGGLNFDGLRVWDSRGEPLPASFVQVRENTFAIQINDDGAVYPVTVDPYLAVWGTYDVNQSGAQFGTSAAPTGEISNSTANGVLIGAPYYDDGQTDEGKVFVFDLSSYSNTPIWTAQINQAYAHFGAAVAANFDVDSDNFMDVAVSAPDWDETTYSRGKVWVWKGSASGLASGSDGTTGNALWSKMGDQGYDYFGTSLAVGDITGLGGGSSVPDLIVGAPGVDDYNSPYAQEIGKVSVFGGNGSTFVTSVSWSATGGYYTTYAGGSYIYTGAQFGQCAAVVGNIDNDGYLDFAVGAPSAYVSSTKSGKVFTYLGASGNPSASTSIGAGVSGAKFGWSIAGAKLNGDDYSDVIVGAPFDTNGQTQEGKVRRYPGTSGGLSSTSDDYYEVDQAYARYGWSVSTGDANGDGMTDVIIGAPYWDSPSPTAITNVGLVAFFMLNGADGTVIDDETYFHADGVTNEQQGTCVRYLGSQLTAGGAPGASGGGQVVILHGYDD